MAVAFALPAVLVVVAALLVMAVGVLLVAGIERSTSRSFVDRQRAELAARAGIEEIRGILNREAANDDFIILQSARAMPLVVGHDPVPCLFLARGKVAGTAISFRYVPLFSTASRPSITSELAAPPVEPLVGTTANSRVDFTALPYYDKVSAQWLPLLDAQGKTVARYAYWVEDLQGRIDPKNAGNQKGEDGMHARVAYPFPAPGVNDQAATAEESPLDQIALFAIDPATTADGPNDLKKALVKNRAMLITPDSVLAAAEILPPLPRAAAGHLADLKSRAVEEALVSGIQAYDEQPLVPFVPGIDPSMPGKPKLNLNRIVATGGAAAVDQMADFIHKAYPAFEDRKGGFPENYVKTLAANVIDYADIDDRPTLLDGEYRGIDSYPLTTELALKVDYQNKAEVGGRQYLNFNIRLFAELYNPTNLGVSGSARLSYEVALHMDSIGTGTGSPSFDSAELLGNPTCSSHDLVRIDGRYWSRAQNVQLKPGEYRCYRFADVTYHVDVGTVAGNPVSDATPFSLKENKGESGCSLMWNDDIVERQQGVVRQQGFIYGVSPGGKKTGGYLVGTPDVLTKEHLPGLLYQHEGSPGFYGNTGDPRISHYMNRSRSFPLDESAYPSNASPNRRSVRLSVYKADAAGKPKVYARMLPSEWPDGGHDSSVGKWSPGTSDATELTDSKFNFAYDPAAEYAAIQRISNRGCYFSATELGHVFDPIMYAPMFEDPADTGFFREKSRMPAGQGAWPDAMCGQGSPLYGGGNTLRIGRPEHPAFDRTGGRENRAIGLLDLFHAGQPLAADESLRVGPLVRIDGQVNVNTASRDVLRAIAAGALVMDPALSRKTDTAHAGAPAMAPPTEPLTLEAPQREILADEIADAVIEGRPYPSPSRIALAKNLEGQEVFGNRDIYPDKDNVQWTDSAAEEVFGRIYQAATVRSRNFRVWIVAQSVTPNRPTAKTEVLAEVRRIYTVMADPGERKPDGTIIPGNMKTRILTAHDF